MKLKITRVIKINWKLGFKQHLNLYHRTAHCYDT